MRCAPGYRLLIFPILIPLCAGACGVEVDTLESIQAALDTPYGGFRLDDEIPRFGRDDLDLEPVAAGALPAIPRLGYRDFAPAPGAPQGHVVGFWIDYAKGVGVMGGKWANAQGEVVGHLKGVYGCSKKYGYDWVFLGKLIDLGGNPKGIITGRHRGGHFRGTWVDDEHEVKGTLIGYAAGAQRFSGRWQALEAPRQGLGEIPWHLLR